MTLHSVRARHTESLGPHGELTLPADVFEALLVSLKEGGYQSIRCQQLFDHLQSGASLPQNPILLTFDDGYLDNWTIAAPLLKKYGFQATVFVATDFIHPETITRPTLEDHPSPPERGWMSAQELQQLEADGVFEVQSHTARHSRLPISLNIVDYHRPDARCWWLERNAASPDQLAREEWGATAELVPWGTPVFESEWSSPARAILPPQELQAALCERVADQGGAAFFNFADWHSQLSNLAKEHLAAVVSEPPEQASKRILEDLRRSKDALESILGHSIPFLAWPGGGSSAHGISCALNEVGYTATFGTNRVCPGVTPDITAIPRAYFRQNYRGKFDLSLRVALCRGILDWEAGKVSGYARSFLARRMMALFNNPKTPNLPRRASS
ncbi:MAG: polysaccharide deacetylase family protein [Planctomycetes bacterium]|nr:polysaccharide deacetylase family protein [Planctomycetota bacterium]